jgi:hypothetical protein
MFHLRPSGVKTSEEGDFISPFAAKMGAHIHLIPGAMWHRPVLWVRLYQKLRLFVRPFESPRSFMFDRCVQDTPRLAGPSSADDDEHDVMARIQAISPSSSCKIVPDAP